MTDTQNNQPLEPISALQSGTVIKQITLALGAISSFVYSICAIFGIVVEPQLQEKIGMAGGSLAVLIVALWTIHNRITKPCPPIVPKSQLNNGAPQ